MGVARRALKWFKRHCKRPYPPRGSPRSVWVLYVLRVGTALVLLCLALVAACVSFIQDHDPVVFGVSLSIGVLVFVVAFCNECVDTEMAETKALRQEMLARDKATLRAAHEADGVVREATLRAAREADEATLLAAREAAKEGDVATLLAAREADEVVRKATLRAAYEADEAVRSRSFVERLEQERRVIRREWEYELREILGKQYECGYQHHVLRNLENKSVRLLPLLPSEEKRTALRELTGPLECFLQPLRDYPEEQKQYIGSYGIIKRGVNGKLTIWKRWSVIQLAQEQVLVPLYRANGIDLRPEEVAALETPGGPSPETIVAEFRRLYTLEDGKPRYGVLEMPYRAVRFEVPLVLDSGKSVIVTVSPLIDYVHVLSWVITLL